jgi:hypothetical protein
MLMLWHIFFPGSKRLVTKNLDRVNPSKKVDSFYKTLDIDYRTDRSTILAATAGNDRLANVYEATEPLKKGIGSSM